MKILFLLLLWTSSAFAFTAFDPASVDFTKLIPAPPAAGSDVDKADIKKLLDAQEHRSKAQCDEAVSERRLSVTKMFAAPRGPLTSDEVKRFEPALEDAMSDVDTVVRTAKVKFNRLRPYDRDSRLHPCAKKEKSLAYPSGHSTLAHFVARVVAEIHPEARDKLMQLAWRTAQNRVLGGVHHPSDIEAGKHLADALFEIAWKNLAFRDKFDVKKKP